MAAIVNRAGRIGGCQSVNAPGAPHLSCRWRVVEAPGRSRGPPPPSPDGRRLGAEALAAELHESQQRGGGGGDFCCPGECRRQPMVRPRTRRSSIASTCPVSAGRPASTRERHSCRRSLRGRLAWREHSGPVVLLLLVQGGCLSRGRASRRRGVCRDLTRLVGLESVLG